MTFELIPTGIKVHNEQIAAGFILHQNYPNPFNAETRISFKIPSLATVTVSIFNATGELVEKLYQGIKSAGEHKMTWNARGISSGIYFYKVETDDFTATGKCLLLK